jgi:hypothetical protein
VEKFFNTAGPSKEDLNYMVDPLRRVDYDEISLLIANQRYFVLHAPRQTGKTTSLLAMVKQINEEGRYRCVYMNVEAAQTARDDVAGGMKIIVGVLASQTKRFLGVPLLMDELTAFPDRFGNNMFNAALSLLSQNLDKPLVLFIDEIDSLVGDTLVSVLRQLRAGYESRPQEFPISVVLCGVRDVRDYRIHTSKGDIVTGGSCFNIKAKSLRLGDFSRDEVRELYEQHTTATGQVFEEDIYPRVWELTHGQPWLVNALAHQAAFEMKENRDRKRPITLEVVDEAAEQLIFERATHLDQLADKLHEERVRRVVAPMIVGEGWQEETRPSSDDIQYVLDLGLIRNDGGNYVIANDIYREVLPRELSYVMQVGMTSYPTQPWYVADDGQMDIGKLLREFQQFFRENVESWKKRFDYEEAGFQLLLQAFLQRIVNGGGFIAREYALGSGRVDILVRWRTKAQGALNAQGAVNARDAQSAPPRSEQRFALELKTIREKTRAPNSVLTKGLEQTARYADRSNAEEAHLIICDERPGRSWDEKIYDRIERCGGREIHIWGV